MTSSTIPAESGRPAHYARVTSSAAWVRVLVAVSVVAAHCALTQPAAAPLSAASAAASSRRVQPVRLKLVVGQDPELRVAPAAVGQRIEPDEHNKAPVEPREQPPATLRIESSLPVDDGLHRSSPRAHRIGAGASLTEVVQPRLAAPTPEEIYTGLRPIGTLTLDVHPKEPPPAMEVPYWAAEEPVDGTWAGADRGWAPFAYLWEAPAVCHQPLYFEEVNLERHGYSFGLAQPVLSGAHFFGTVPLLPYKMAAQRPRDCVFTLGHYRPGSYAPWQVHRLPLRLDAAAVQGGVVAGLIFLIP